MAAAIWTLDRLMFWFGRRGKKELLDFRGLNLSPVDAYRRSRGQRFLLEIPAANLCAAGFNGADPHNPFVLSMRAYAEGRCLNFRGSLLEDFYNSWQPFAGTESVPAERAAPWRQGRVLARNTSAGRLQRGEFIQIARELGLQPGEIRGHIKGGPVTEAFGEVTFRRIAKIHDSIRENGYQPEKVSAGHLHGMCFVNGDDFRVVIGSGKHRVAALLALGWDVIPVQFGPPKLPVIVQRSEVDHWPGVCSGTYERGEALASFDSIFTTSHPSGWRAPQT